MTFIYSVSKYRLPSGMKKMAFLFMILFCYTASEAQVSGYLGKRIMAGYSGSLRTNILIGGVIDNLSGIDAQQYALIYRHGIEAQYITGRKNTLGLEATFFNSNISTLALDYDGKSAAIPTYDVSMGSLSYGITYRTYGIFGNSALAPIGKYISLKLYKNRFTLKDPLGYMIRNGSVSKPEALSYSNSSTNFALGYGISRVIKDVAVLDIGVQVDVPIYTPVDITSDLNETLKKIAGGYVNGVGSFSFRMELSGLLF
jgi:hypothetical protein